MSNYVFPELTTYSEAWITVLAEARKLFEQGEAAHLCTALHLVAKAYKDKFKEPDRKERAAIADYFTLADEIVAAIEMAIYDYHTVTYWLSLKHPAVKYDEVGYRLAWIDHIIKECEK